MANFCTQNMFLIWLRPIVACRVPRSDSTHKYLLLINSTVSKELDFSNSTKRAKCFLVV